MAASKAKTRKDAATSSKLKKTSSRRTAKPKPKLDATPDSDLVSEESVEEADEDAYQEENTGSREEEDEEKDLDSDALDESDFETGPGAAGRGKKRKRAPASAKSSPKKKTAAPRKSQSPRKKSKKDANEEEEEDDEFEGLEVVGDIVLAPTTGRVPPGQISRNTFNFLKDLQKPECNDREWFKLHEPVFRLAESEWKAFIEEFTLQLVETDSQIPVLPPKDVVHRIYRDVRFSNDKTPYKTGFSASFSRSGRKGVFAHYHLLIKPGGSLIAGGAWCPGRNELQTIRAHILRNPTRLRTVLSAPAFVSHFGKPKPDPKGGRQSIFGQEDELKTAPKGVDKGHKDIDLLKCRSFAVVHYFTDEQVLSPTFKDDVCEVAAVLRPFVHCLNDMITIPPDDNDSNDDDGDDDEDDGENGVGGEEVEN